MHYATILIQCYYLVSHSVGLYTNWTSINEENVICNVCDDDWNIDHWWGGPTFKKKKKWPFIRRMHHATPKWLLTINRLLDSNSRENKKDDDNDCPKNLWKASMFCICDIAQSLNAGCRAKLKQFFLQLFEETHLVFKLDSKKMKKIILELMVFGLIPNPNFK